MDDPAQNPTPIVPVDTIDTPEPTLTDEIKTFEASAGRTKEQEPVTFSEKAASVEPVVKIEEIPTSPEIEPQHEISGYMEKIEKETELAKPVTDDYTQQVLLKSSVNQNPIVTLPLTEGQVEMGLHRQVWEAIRWLAVWCVRQAKVLHGRVKYKQ